MIARRREQTQEEIKNVARRQMAAGGTASISLRAIARELDVSVTALYRYYENADALITALIVDAFTALAEALEAAQAERAGGSPIAGLMHVMSAYRLWALEHPTDFALIYGNPIPGYHAPPDTTVPIVVRNFVVLVSMLEAARLAGELRPTRSYTEIPPTVETRLVELINEGSYPVSPLMMYLGMILWTHAHGMIILELFHHLPPNINDSDAFYVSAIDHLLTAMGA